MATLETVPFGPPTTGGWCDRCLLPSVITQELVGLRGNAETCRIVTDRCDECGRMTARQTSGLTTRIIIRP